MSSLDPFGGPPRPAGGYGTFKPRSKGNDGMAIWKNLEGSAKDFGSTVGSQLTGKGSRGWQGFNGILAIVNMVFGAIFLMLSVKMGDVVLLATAIAVGAVPGTAFACAAYRCCELHEFVHLLRFVSFVFCLDGGRSRPPSRRTEVPCGECVHSHSMPSCTSVHLS